MSDWMDQQMYACMIRLINERKSSMNEKWINAKVNSWNNGCKNQRMNEWAN